MAEGPGRPQLLPLLLLFLIAHHTLGHVNLVFPPARQPALDFYSSSNSMPPCGIPKPPEGKGVRTFLQAGSEVEMEWFTSVPHIGGIRIEVLNALDQPIAIFTNFNDEYNVSSPLKKIALPQQFECQNCALRLTHQATEYGNEFQFFSCADVNIVPTIPDGDSCLGRGARVDGVCHCDGSYTGDFCQVQNECAKPTECGSHGLCRDTKNEQPAGQCYCQRGYFGEHCEKVSRAANSPNDFDASLYNMREADDNKIYWRIIEDEIEFVLKFPGTSWAGIGWKPMDHVCPTPVPQPPLYEQKAITYPKKTSAEKVDQLKKVEIKPEHAAPTPSSTSSESNVAQHTSEDASDFSVEGQSAEYGDEEDAADLPFAMTPDLTEASSSAPSTSTLSSSSSRSTTTATGAPTATTTLRAKTSTTTTTITTAATKAKDTTTSAKSTTQAATTQRTTSATKLANIESEIDSSVEYEDVDNAESTSTTMTTTTAAKSATTISTTRPTMHSSVVESESVEDTSAQSESNCGENEQFSKCPEMSRECEASCDWTSCPANATFAKCGTACEPSCENMYDTSPCPASCETAACTCSDNFVRYNGACIYWGDCPKEHMEEEEHALEKATENSHSVQPASASISLKSSTAGAAPTKESTVCLFANCSVAQSLKPAQTVCPVNETMSECGRVCEADCISIFTRTACDECGDPNCSCIQGYVRNPAGTCIYWGDCPKDIQSTQPSQPHFHFAESTTPYHTTTPQPQRTPPKKELATDNERCYGDWRFPEGCKDCDYKLSWNFVEDSDEVEFSLETKLPQNWWTGVGFSPAGTMADADMIIITSNNGRLKVLDMYSGSYGVPTLDASQVVIVHAPYQMQDVKSPNVVGTHANGVLRAQFTRKRNTGDAAGDKALSSTECLSFLFPVEGGRLDAHGNITIHASTPIVSARKICVAGCNSGEAAEATARPSSSSSSSASEVCESEYRYPPSCVDTACDYIAKWHYDESLNDVKFEISSKDLGRWTGIGFSKDGQMTNADIYTGWVYEGRGYVTDRFAYGRQLPAIDPADRSDIYDVQGRIVDDVQTITFRRPVVPRDTVTDLPLDHCYYFMFPVGGGRVLARKSSDFTNPRTPIGFHDQRTPKVSASKICLCNRAGEPLRAPEPHQVRVRRQTLRKAPGSAMDCADIVVGAVFDGRGRVRDMFSPSKSTPRLDAFFGAADDLTSASAYSEDGLTTVVFRRKLDSSDPADHSIVPGPMTVIWAKGADASNYQHTTGGAPLKADPAFFGLNTFKYHGMNHRGVLTIDFFATQSPKATSQSAKPVVVATTTPRPLPIVPDAPRPEVPGYPSCAGRFSYPRGCDTSNCLLLVAWSSDGTEVSFHVEADLADRRWTAVGFSRDGGMANSDAIIVSVERSEVSVVDHFMPNYGRPQIDEQQDIYDIETSYISGRAFANFSRRLASDDSVGLIFAEPRVQNDVSLTDCQFFLFTPTGGALSPRGDVHKHQDVPISSQTRICLSACGGSSTVRPVTITTTTEEAPSTRRVPDQTPPPSTTMPPQSSTTTTTTTGVRVALPPIVSYSDDAKKRYGLRVRVLNREYRPELADPQTKYYRSFTKEFSDAINALLARKWKGMKVSKIVEYSKGSVVVEFEVDAADSEPLAKEVSALIEEAAMRGELPGFVVEPSTVKVKQMEVPMPKKTTPKNGAMDESMENVFAGMSFDRELVRNVVVIAIAALVLLLALICCCCIMCRVKRTRHEFSPMRSESLEGKSYSDIPYTADSYNLPHPASYGAYGTLPAKKNPMAGFENKAYQGSAAGSHSRHFSQATTASTKQGNTSPAPSGHGQESMPDGMGETTYHEWYNKVASKPAAQYHEEALSTPPINSSSARPPSATPYVSYPNDPSAYYTLGGEHRANHRKNPY